MRTSIRAALVLASALFPVPVRAHEFWLAPSQYAPRPGQTTAVTARTGEGFCGAPKPWVTERSVRFPVRASKLLEVKGAARPGDEVWLRFAPTDLGGAMLGFQSTFTPIELPAAAFHAYLVEEGLTAVREARGASEEPGRERYRRCAKVWLMGDDPSRATEPLGLPLEIVPQSTPGSDSVLVVAVLREGQPLAGALVRAWRAPLDVSGAALDAATRDSSTMVWEKRTWTDGLVSVPVRESGEWLVSLVDMVPSSEPSEADWESTWASLTFARSAPATATPASPAAAIPAASGSAVGAATR